MTIKQGALLTRNGSYVCAEGGGGRELVANRNAIGAWETFRYIWWPGEDKISFQAADGSYVCAEGGGGGAVVANRPGIGDWEKFSIAVA